MSLLGQNMTRKEQVDKKTLLLKFENNGKGKEYKVAAICGSAIYTKKSKSCYLLGLYYLIF